MEETNQVCEAKVFMVIWTVIIIFILLINFPFLLIILFFIHLKINFRKVLEKFWFYKCLKKVLGLEKNSIEHFLNEMYNSKENKENKNIKIENKKSKNLYNKREENIKEKLEKLKKDEILFSQKLDLEKKKNQEEKIILKSEKNNEKKFVFSDRKSIFDDYESVMDKFKKN